MKKFHTNGLKFVRNDLKGQASKTGYSILGSIETNKSLLVVCILLFSSF
jgi:hypothetical protein